MHRGIPSPASPPGRPGRQPYVVFKLTISLGGGSDRIVGAATTIPSPPAPWTQADRRGTAIAQLSPGAAEGFRRKPPDGPEEDR